jgi:hypothetical protein
VSEPAIIDDLSERPRFARDRAAETGYVPEAIMIAPLLREERTLGVLSVLDRGSSGRSTLQELELLVHFDDQAAPAKRPAAPPPCSMPAPTTSSRPSPRSLAASKPLPASDVMPASRCSKRSACSWANDPRPRPPLTRARLQPTSCAPRPADMGAGLSSGQ